VQVLNGYFGHKNNGFFVTNEKTTLVHQQNNYFSILYSLLNF